MLWEQAAGTTEEEGWEEEKGESVLVKDADRGREGFPGPRWSLVCWGVAGAEAGNNVVVSLGRARMDDPQNVMDPATAEEQLGSKADAGGRDEQDVDGSFGSSFREHALRLRRTPVNQADKESVVTLAAQTERVGGWKKKTAGCLSHMYICSWTPKESCPRSHHSHCINRLLMSPQSEPNTESSVYKNTYHTGSTSIKSDAGQTTVAGCQPRRSARS